MSQTISIGDRISNSINKVGGVFETITGVTFAVNSAKKTIATITTVTQTIIKYVDLISISEASNNSTEGWVVGQ